MILNYKIYIYAIKYYSSSSLQKALIIESLMFRGRMFESIGLEKKQMIYYQQKKKLTINFSK